MKLTCLKTRREKSKGFSLVELIVAVSIIIIISSVALFHQAKFSSDILISNMAYEVALAIRQAQVYGISSKGNISAGTYQYRAGYGVHFTGLVGGQKPDSFVTFINVPRGPAITPGENTPFDDYTYGSGDILLDTPELTQGQKIHRFCAREVLDGWQCWDSGPLQSNMTLDIVFVKPNPDAHITIGINNSYDLTKKYDQAKIVIESGLGDKCRTVRVRISGQVSVDAASADAAAGCDPTVEN